LGIKDVLDSTEVSVGEDKTSVANKLVTDNIEVGALLPAAETGHLLLVVFLPLIRLSDDVGDSGFEVGVLSHDHLGTDGTELLAHDADLLGGDVVDFHKHDLFEVEAGLLELFPAGGLHLLLGSLGHFVV